MATTKKTTTTKKAATAAIKTKTKKPTVAELQAKVEQLNSLLEDTTNERIKDCSLIDKLNSENSDLLAYLKQQEDLAYSYRIKYLDLKRKPILQIIIDRIRGKE